MRNPIHPEDIEAARNGLRRSSHWPQIERLHLATQPRCACCTPSMCPDAGVQVHHIFPFHYCIALGRANLELDARNLITLCEDEQGKPGQNHHLLVGHLDSFQSSNLHVVAAAKFTFHGMTSAQITESHLWQRMVARRLKPLAEMSAVDRANFARLMNARLPMLG